ncbi:MAG: ATPase, T2SS/T4P/T4SS family, partial [Lachnospiraceae bacterium]|nr:ATPase, T2SS/T4P/T4SS family [Lachnospiraceae bacterium]
MAEELRTTQAALNSGLERTLENVVSVITKNYLSELEEYELIPPSLEDMDIEAAECGCFFRLTRLVLNREENFLDKLTTIVNVASAINSSLATIIRSDGGRIDYYIGILSKNHRQENEKERRKREADAKAFAGALSGNLQGSELQQLSATETRALTDAIFSREGNCYAAISGVVSLRDKEKKQTENYVQGMENLVDSLKGLSYTILMLADPVSTSEIQTVKQGYETLHTELATFFKQSLTLNETDTWSLSASQTRGISEGLSKGISMTQSTTISKGKYLGGTVGGGLGLGILSVHAGISGGSSWGNAQTSGSTDTRSESEQRSRSNTRTASASQAAGKSLQIHYENRSVHALLDQIDRNLDRLDQCESFGAFECAAYVVANEQETALTVASNYNALMRGRESHVQSSHINMWYQETKTERIGRYLRAFVHPRFSRGEERRLNKVIVTPASLVSGNELAIQIGLPKKSINGITVIPMAPFGRNIRSLENREGLMLGHLYHMGQEEGTAACRQGVSLDLQSLASHLFITGSTGSGKTTAIYAILEKLRKQGIKFLVIEPAKGEYKHRFGNDADVRVYGTNQKKTPLLRINPFCFPEDVHVLEHIDRLIEI